MGESTIRGLACAARERRGKGSAREFAYEDKPRIVVELLINALDKAYGLGEQKIRLTEHSTVPIPFP